MRKKITAIALSAVLACTPLALAGCSSSPSSSDDNSSGTESSQAAEPTSIEETVDAAVAKAEEEGKEMESVEYADDCDGSGNGSAEITYTDGSSEIVEYNGN